MFEDWIRPGLILAGGKDNQLYRLVILENDTAVFRALAFTRNPYGLVTRTLEELKSDLNNGCCVYPVPCLN
jgi:hypothetical protein